MALIQDRLQRFVARLEPLIAPERIRSYEYDFDSGDVGIRLGTGRLWVLPSEFLDEGAISEADWFVAGTASNVFEHLDQMIHTHSLNWHELKKEYSQYKSQYLNGLSVTQPIAYPKLSPPRPSASDVIRRIAKSLGMSVEHYHQWISFK